MVGSGLTYVLDQNLSANILAMLRDAGAEPVGRITSLAELGYPGDTPDAVWLSDLGRVASTVLSRETARSCKLRLSARPGAALRCL